MTAAETGETQLEFDSTSFPKLTHYLFRYPAKFHPPVARALLTRYVSPQGWVLDPFCGSGSLLVEARVVGINAVGSDVDPVAVFTTNVKIRRYALDPLRRSSAKILKLLQAAARSEGEYVDRQFADLTEDEYLVEAARTTLPIPAIPNLFHWFRKYVIIDLARILRALRSRPMPTLHREFLLLCFSSIIRAASNADPVPVSGLEVTSHMRRRDEAGRVINPFALFENAVKRSLKAVAEYVELSDASVRVTARHGDATVLRRPAGITFDAAITSPPYHNAVDYYRRHQLEMYWLGFTVTREDRLKLLPQYIGRATPPRSHPFIADAIIRSELATEWHHKIRSVDERRANGFKHYVIAMSRVFDRLHALVRPEGKVVFVVGHSTWNGATIPTAALLRDLAGDRFEFLEQLTYPIPNRYMSYARRNGASIDREYVVAFNRLP